MIDRIATTAAIAVRQAGAYTDLIQSDLEASSRLVRRRVALGALAVLAIQSLVLVLSVSAIALSWSTGYRLWVVGALGVLFAGVAVVAAWRLNALEATAPAVFQRTADEWAKDRRVLEELLARQQAEAR
ncbi:MAG: hypothetical protein JSR36_14590 [Proteobacteria bacterium]|nr:hypothetical protein [Pseudomonadota bacterium]